MKIFFAQEYTVSTKVFRILNIAILHSFASVGCGDFTGSGMLSGAHSASNLL